MIPSEWPILTGAALLLAACDRAATPVPPAEAERINARAVPKTDTGTAHRADAPLQAPATKGGPAPDRMLASTLVKKETIAIAGQPACALTVRYGDGEEQPVTWRGESCADILVQLVSIEDLRRIGQDSKLGEEARDDLARLPGGRAIYVEGSHSSALYPANVINRVYEVPLAD